MRTIVRNALVGATISCLLATGLLLFVSHSLRDALTISPLLIHWAVLERLAAAFLYMWCAAILGAIIYGALAARLGIYGRGSDALHKWKNGLLGVLIVIPMIAIVPVTSGLIGVSPEISAPFVVALGCAIAISDARAPAGASMLRD